MSEEQPLVPWAERLAQSAKAVAALERPSLSQISLRGGVMSLNSVPVPGNKLLCVIVASAFENQFYDKAFDPNVKENPLCFALSADGKDMVPHDNSKEKQSTTCEMCPQLAWGSDPRPNSKGKACKQKRRLALLPHSALEADKIKSAEMATLTIPVMSAKNWANYVNQVASQSARPPWAVLTEVSCHPDPRKQFEVRFELKALIHEQFLDDVHARIEGAMQVLMTPYEVAPPEQEKKPPVDDKKRKF
jgi:hypothetical protein